MLYVRMRTLLESLEISRPRFRKFNSKYIERSKLHARYLGRAIQTFHTGMRILCQIIGHSTLAVAHYCNVYSAEY
jgi:hypothetical protein